MLRQKPMIVGLSMLVVAASALTASAQSAIADRKLPATELRKMKPQLHPSQNAKLSGAKTNSGIHPNLSSGISGIESVVNWSDGFFSPGYDSYGNPQSFWPFTMVGNSPESGQTASITAPIIPVTVQLLGADGKVALTFGPDAKVIDDAMESPEFASNKYTNGQGQFNDQMMRAQFADRLHGDQGSDWHTILYPKLRTARTIQIPYFTAGGTKAWYYFVDAAQQPILAAIDESTFGNLLFPPTYPVDNSTPIGAAERAGDITPRDISTFLFDNTVLFSGNIQNCCIIGFHTFDQEPGTAKNGNLPRLYVLNFSSWLSPGLFFYGFEDMTAWSHEMAETFNDPFDNNLTPWWESVDPASGGGNCQNNLEVGDVVEVLSSLNPVSTIPGDKLTYHPQNEALFPWFAFQSPSTAHLKAYSFPDETTLMSLSPGPLLPGCVAAP